MSHKWSWCTGEWSTLPETLVKLEKEGWEIFSISPIGDLDRFVHIVTRRGGKSETKKIKRLREAILWALGYGKDEFRPGEPHEGKYFWRSELAKRAGFVNEKWEEVSIK